MRLGRERPFLSNRFGVTAAADVDLVGGVKTVSSGDLEKEARRMN